MRFAAGVTLFNVTVASGFSIAGLARPELIAPAGAAPNAASAIFAMYAAARSLPLGVAVVAAVIAGSAPALLVLGGLAGSIQAVDAIVGLVHHDAGKTIGPMILAALQFNALTGLWRERRR